MITTKHRTATADILARPKIPPEAQRLLEVYRATKSPKDLAAYHKFLDDARQEWIEKMKRIRGPEWEPKDHDDDGVLR